MSEGKLRTVTEASSDVAAVEDRSFSRSSRQRGDYPKRDSWTAVLEEGETKSFSSRGHASNSEKKKKCCSCCGGCSTCCPKQFQKMMELYTSFTTWVQELLAKLILRPLGMSDDDPVIAGRIERMAISCIYIFFKCLVSLIIEYKRGWLVPAITFSALCVSIPLLFYFAVVWRHLALTTAFLVLNLAAFGVTLSIWCIFLTNIIRRGLGYESGYDWFDQNAEGEYNALTFFSFITIFLLIIALLLNTIESLNFARFIQKCEEDRKKGMEERLTELVKQNQELQSQLLGMEECLVEMEGMFMPLQHQSIRNSFVQRISPGLDPAVPCVWGESSPSALVFARQIARRRQSRMVMPPQNASSRFSLQSFPPSQSMGVIGTADPSPAMSEAFFSPSEADCSVAGGYRKRRHKSHECISYPHFIKYAPVKESGSSG